MNATDTTPPVGYQGTEKLLWGIVLAVITFWLFAGTAGTVAPAIMADVNAGGKQYVDASSMNLAVSITALFSGLFIVLMGGTADKVGRVKITQVGIIAGIIGSALLLFSSGPLALPLLLTGRAIQGFSAACIMPASMALVKSYWDGPARQRAVSMWSIGSWGGSGLAALFGGFVVQYVGWRGIFAASIVISVIAFVMIWGTPENKVASTGRRAAFDIVGLILFIVGTLSLMIVLLFGKKLGWGSPTVLGLAVLAVLAWGTFVFVERGKANPFIDFTLFKNTTFTGATLSNFLLNATIGMLIVSQQLIQLAGRKADGSAYTAWDAGLLTIGYAVFIIAFIRVGEKLLQRFGPRKPMLWGTLIVITACLLLMMTHLLIGQYVVMAIIAYCLFGFGLAFYATPSTDAALSNLPAAQAGSGAGIYKMASSLGGAIGAAISLAVFTAMASVPADIVGNVLHMQGRVDNIGLRQAGMIALGVNLVFLLLAIIAIVMTVPKGMGRKEASKPEGTPAPAAQHTLDEEKAVVLGRLAELPLATLKDLEGRAYKE
ncbi:MFS transporter [Dermatophilus congolensis]|uniref:Quinolone resistance protein norB n=1 Tax=Dermatophilus congolensis TaxID=1863 RepID=A0A239VBJ5_9MICO|nr:MFS transporter [Dermatophilus congolensis]MBO3128476.1 MFS transporter [Dermatophilus congolensis]MBO3132886.1 MFS transporter [Dermatophilus congolensis]MBO3132955.1 MFS transporter [Dermatophilus congolensis]MBO3135192.1 MFS transporter [Dermatophilus congolensis]MBO3137428.1 MFS transporter [Dermatophilus congolensis]